MNRNNYPVPIWLAHQQEDCRYCILGALAKSQNKGSLDYDADFDKLYDKIGEYGYDKGLASWNDEYGRTKEEVITLLKACGL